MEKKFRCLPTGLQVYVTTLYINEYLALMYVHVTLYLVTVIIALYLYLCNNTVLYMYSLSVMEL